MTVNEIEIVGDERFKLEVAVLLHTVSLTLVALSRQTILLFRGSVGREALHWVSLPWSH